MPEPISEALQRLLARLRKGHQLRRAGAGYLLAGRRGPKTLVAGELVAAALADGLVRETDDGLVVTAGGLRWLEGGDPRLAQHQELETRLIKDDYGREHYVVVNAAESPLSLVRRRGWISAQQFEAGEKLRRDYTIGGLTPRMGVDYAAPVGGRSFRADLADTVVAARQRFNQALKAAGPGLSEVLFDVCCYLTALEDCEQRHGWPRGSAKVVLGLALDRLASHYGMGCADAPGRMRSWSQE